VLHKDNIDFYVLFPSEVFDVEILENNGSLWDVSLVTLNLDVLDPSQINALNYGGNNLTINKNIKALKYTLKQNTPTNIYGIGSATIKFADATRLRSYAPKIRFRLAEGFDYNQVRVSPRVYLQTKPVTASGPDDAYYYDYGSGILRLPDFQTIYNQ